MFLLNLTDTEKVVVHERTIPENNSSVVIGVSVGAFIGQIREDLSKTKTFYYFAHLFLNYANTVLQINNKEVLLVSVPVEKRSRRALIRLFELKFPKPNLNQQVLSIFCPSNTSY